MAQVNYGVPNFRELALTQASVKLGTEPVGGLKFSKQHEVMFLPRDSFIFKMFAANGGFASVHKVDRNVWLCVTQAGQIFQSNADPRTLPYQPGGTPTQ